MKYQVVVSPDLDLSPQEVVTAWNEDEQACASASAWLTQPSVRSFDPTLAVVITLVSTVGVGLLTNALYDVLKAALLKKEDRRPHTRIKVTQLDRPDGTHLLIVEREED